MNYSQHQNQANPNNQAENQDKIKSWEEIKNGWQNDWITSSYGITKEAIKWAEDFGKYLAVDKNKIKKLTTSQLRKFFSHLKRMQAIGFDENNKTDLYMLKAQLAYANGRDKKEGGQNKTKICHFAEMLFEAIDQVQTKEHFKNFANIVEAIVAFHKAAGGE
ncbi:MAG: type III-A CRISPR-associated protein Csm2 [Bacteroidales bacterium]|nr:type III-A CRISPR-associated protein Csm2 [Bacteroidales bacterium]